MVCQHISPSQCGGNQCELYMASNAICFDAHHRIYPHSECKGVYGGNKPCQCYCHKIVVASSFKKCICDLRKLMNLGCQCGGV